MKNIKLSDKQKEVIKLMRDKWYPETSVFFHNQVLLTHIEQAPKRLRWITFQKILSLDLIYCASPDYCKRKQYGLTKLGKTIEL